MPQILTHTPKDTQTHAHAYLDTTAKAWWLGENANSSEVKLYLQKGNHLWMRELSNPGEVGRMDSEWNGKLGGGKNFAQRPFWKTT